MRELNFDDCQMVTGGVDYYTWSQYGAALGAVIGMARCLSGPMTGASLAFKPFELVLNGIFGAGLGIIGGVVAAVIYQGAVTAYEHYDSSGGFNWSSLAMLAVI